MKFTPLSKMARSRIFDLSVNSQAMELTLLRTTDFELDGQGNSPAWDLTAWHPLVGISETTIPATRFKALYSETGLYFLADCEDRKLTCTLTEDFADLFREDVIEVFLQPDATQPVYFEYEISPLNKELPLLISNHEGNFHGWLPWHFEKKRRTRKATHIRGGEKLPLAECTGWSAEFFIPFALLNGLGNLPVKSGTRWKANLYRIDYDGPTAAQSAWEPQVGQNFHAFEEFGTFVFG